VPTKTERILGNLPSTFRAFPRPSALYAVTAAFGGELLGAENSLAAVMRAHWVDHADLGADLIDDLARIGGLYGLAPRPDESVEEFRRHLKRHVRTLLEGAVTVQGILRVTAEALGLEIADAYPHLDSWWTRGGGPLVTESPRGEDAGSLVFGIDGASVRGHGAREASVAGTVDLSGGADLRNAPALRLAVNGAAGVSVDVAAAAADPSRVTLDETVGAVNSALGSPMAEKEGSRLVLRSPTAGAGSSLVVEDVDGDAAEPLLGLPPRTRSGSDAAAARIEGAIDLPPTLDLSEVRYLRLVVDQAHLAEVDCAGPDWANTSLDHVREAIDSGLGMPVATIEGSRLVLTSPSTGASSSLQLLHPAGQEATDRLFGPVERLNLGRDAAPATVTGPDLDQGVDLSAGRHIAVSVDGNPAVVVDCSGADPTRTFPAEIVAAIESVLPSVASTDGRAVTLRSRTVGAAATVRFDTPPDGDAAETLFGIRPRSFAGVDAASAVLDGTADLSHGVDLSARHVVSASVDGGPWVEVDLRTAASDPRAVTQEELAGALNAALGDIVAEPVGPALRLASPTAGEASSVSLAPLSARVSRRFVTRAVITTEAATAVLGFVARSASGTPATSATVRGKPDLSIGADLRQRRYVRLGIDGGEPRDIACAGPRPRATTVQDAVAAINAGLGLDVAGHDGKHLILTSPTRGSGSRVSFEAPGVTDALRESIGLVPGMFRGQDPTRISFLGTVDLSGGVDLSGPDHVKIGFDAHPPVDVACAGADPAHTRVDEVVSAINTALGALVAWTDGSYVRLTSPSVGATSAIALEPADGPDATAAVFGVSPPRSYHGEPALPAEVVGSADLSGGADLSTARYLRVAIDGDQPVLVDCAVEAATPGSATVDEIVSSIAADLGAGVASAEGGHLKLTSRVSGLAGSISLTEATAPELDARSVLMGDVPDVTTGTDARPAELTGDLALLETADLSDRRRLRLSVDGGPPQDLDVSGLAPSATSLAEVIAAIEARLPGVASYSDDGRLRLRSPGTSETSEIAVIPLRYLEVEEYPVERREEPPHQVRHGDSLVVTNDGGAEACATVIVRAPHGAVGPSLVNGALGWQVRVLRTLGVGDSLELALDGRGRLRARVATAAGATRPVPPREIIVGPLGAQAWVPYEGAWRLSGDHDPPSLQLNDPLSGRIVLLEALPSGDAGKDVAVSVAEAALQDWPMPPASGGGQATLRGQVTEDDPPRTGLVLVDASGARSADLRPGPDADLEGHTGRVVSVSGPLYVGEGGGPPVLVAGAVACLYDVVVRGPAGGQGIEERFDAVTVGAGQEDPDSLVARVNGVEGSRLVEARELDPATVLTVLPGASEWRYVDCQGTRYDESNFDQARFSGGGCDDRGVFDVSRFSRTPPEPVRGVFAAASPLPDPPVTVAFAWDRARPGTFVVNLPEDLPERFGGLFNEARFAKGEVSAGTGAGPGAVSGQPGELWEGAVVEPASDPEFLVTLINVGSAAAPPSALVRAEVVPFVPLGFRAARMPFRKPQRLTLGTSAAPARLFLSEDGLEGFIQISTREAGEWGNHIAVTARRSGPALYDVTVSYEAGRFESARSTAMGKPLQAAAHAFIAAGPFGVLEAKAAGTRAGLARNRVGTVMWSA